MRSGLTVNTTLRETETDAGELFLEWTDPESGEARSMVATERELMVLTMIREGISEETAAAEGGVSPEVVAQVVDLVVETGLVLAPPPGLHRSPEDFPIPEDAPWDMVACGRFSLQWHLTNACDLHCAHCYDRTKVKALRLPQALAILEDFRAFCRHHRMAGEVCLTGGNPLMYPWFWELYQAVADSGLAISLLGNPAPRDQIERLCAIAKPEHFQLSLEGLEAHNDKIRGKGHFKRVFSFLEMLRELEIESGIMLTLTRDNMEQVIPLGKMLQGHADGFTFNRLAQVGEGANLAIPGSAAYMAFLEAYDAAAEETPVMGYKDNLFNILRERNGEWMHAGCTGYGCGAAFNFVAVLPDGQVDACRKFPSPIGNMLEASLEEIYESNAAKGYRKGCSACHDCSLRLWCGGCLAVSHGAGLDPLVDRDPHCPLPPAGI